MDDPAPDPVPHAVLSATSHELRGPLGVIRGYLRLLEGQLAIETPARRSVEQAGAAATRMAELLDELSEYARWARGDTQLVRAHTSMRGVVSAALETAAVANPHVRFTLSDGPDVEAPIDGPRLTRAVASLAVALARTQDEDGVVTLRLSAAGPERAALHIEPAGHAHTTVEERPVAVERAGAGLSLALATLIVTGHGGSIVERWDKEGWKGYHLVIA